MTEHIINLGVPPVYCRVQTNKLTIDGWVWNGSEIENPVVLIQPALIPNTEATMFALPMDAIRSITPLAAPEQPALKPLWHQLSGWGFK